MENQQLLRRIATIRSCYTTNFENQWFSMLVEGLPIDPQLLKEVLDFLKIDEAWAVDNGRALEGVRSLELFVLTLRHYLLPTLKERLRISPLRPDMMIRDRDQRAIRALVAYSIPVKIELLDDLIKAFKDALTDADKPTVVTVEATA